MERSKRQIGGRGISRSCSIRRRMSARRASIRSAFTLPTRVGRRFSEKQFRKKERMLSLRTHHIHPKFCVDAVRAVSASSGAADRDKTSPTGCTAANTTEKHTAAFAAVRLRRSTADFGRLRQFAYRREAGVCDSWRDEWSRAQRLPAKSGCSSDRDCARSCSRKRALARREERAFAGSRWPRDVLLRSWRSEEHTSELQ